MRSFAVLLFVVHTAVATAAPLALDEVLQSIDAHPAIAAGQASVERAEGDQLAASGAFDLQFRTRTERIIGYYDNLLLATEFRKPTRWRGLSAYAGWRLGRGDFPDYDLKMATLDRGELRAGLELPLLRDGAIDRARADERKAGFAIAVGRAELSRRTLELERDAALGYWDWVGAGQRLAIRERQLELARRRDRDLRRTIDEGNAAPIEGTDNARSIAAREATVVGARRDFARASFELSFFLRESGAPVIPARDRLPVVDALPPPLAAEADVDALIADARARQPALAAVSARLQANRIDLELARNQLLPSLTATGFVARGIGEPDPTLRDRSQLAMGAALTFEVPLERSRATGARIAARAERRRLLAEQQILDERIAIDARTVVTELAAARERAKLATDQAQLAEQLAVAERLRFERGDSTILIVNLREETAAEAAVARIDATIDYLKQRARYVVTLGRSLRE